MGNNERRQNVEWVMGLKMQSGTGKGVRVRGRLHWVVVKGPMRSLHEAVDRREREREIEREKMGVCV